MIPTTPKGLGNNFSFLEKKFQTYHFLCGRVHDFRCFNVWLISSLQVNISAKIVFVGNFFSQAKVFIQGNYQVFCILINNFLQTFQTIDSGVYIQIWC